MVEALPQAPCGDVDVHVSFRVEMTKFWLLLEDMKVRTQLQAERVIHLQQEMPPRIDSDDKRVRPWMGILQNIDNKTRMPTGFRVGAEEDNIKEHLKAFNPESVKVMYDVRGHLGVAVIGFRNSMDGFKDAEAFENSFCCKKRGRRDFEKDYPHSCDGHLYGWMAAKRDVDGISKYSISLVKEHLRLNGDLKSLPEIVSEVENTAQQQVQNLKEVEYHERIIRHYRTQISNRMKQLESKISELETLKLENEAENTRNYADRLEKFLAWYKGQVKQHEEQQDTFEPIKKHIEEESDNLENQLQEQRKKLQAKLACQRVWERLESMKAKKAEMVEARKEVKGKRNRTMPRSGFQS